MSKKKKQQSVQGRDCYIRMNFLYQTALLWAGKNNTLSAYYGDLCKNIGKKAVLSIDPDIKRNLCKRCSLALRPGVTADVTVTSDSGGRRRQKKTASIDLDENVDVHITCRECQFKRSFHVNPDYKFWLESPESVADEILLSIETDSEHIDPKRKKANSVSEERERRNNANVTKFT